jgi:hypothetical protein
MDEDPAVQSSQRERSQVLLQDDDEDDAIIVDPVQHSANKRKGRSGQSSPRPAKRQTVWVEVPPRPKRVPSASVKLERPTQDDIHSIATAPIVKEEPDEEFASALATIRNVSRIPTILLTSHRRRA